MKQFDKIHKVLDAKAVTSRIDGIEVLTIETMGLANTSGWTNAQLSPIFPQVPPADGVMEFVLVAEKPEGPVLPYLMPLRAADYVMYGVPGWQQGIRIKAANNELVVRVDRGDKKFVEGAPAELDYEDLSEVTKTAVVEAEEGDDVGHALISQCHTVPVLKISNWPEFKAKGWRFYRRSCKKEVYAKICHPDMPEIIGDVKDCGRKALAAGGIVALVTAGNFAAAWAIFLEALKSCLIQKGIENVSQVTGGIHTRSECGRWRRI